MKDRHRVSQAVSKLIIDMGNVFAADGHTGRRKSPAGVGLPSYSLATRRGELRLTSRSCQICC
jgi:hypothetical protein